MKQRILTTAYVAWVLLSLMLFLHAWLGQPYSTIVWVATLVYVLLTLFVRVGFTGKTSLGRAVNRLFFPLFRNEALNDLERLESFNLRYSMEVEVFYSEDVFIKQGYKKWRHWLQRRIYEKQDLLPFSETELFS